MNPYLAGIIALVIVCSIMACFIGYLMHEVLKLKSQHKKVINILKLLEKADKHRGEAVGALINASKILASKVDKLSREVEVNN